MARIRLRARVGATILIGLAIGCAGGDQHTTGVDHGEHGSGDAQAVHWGYGEKDGPARWGSLNAEWALCDAGMSQSPIDIRDAAAVSSEADGIAPQFPEASIRVDRQAHVLGVLNNGHSIQVNVDAGDTLTLGEEAFNLLQYHFHSPSEHTVDGRHYPMEMHLVHQSAAGELAGIGVFIEEGKHNAAFDAVWSSMPTERGTDVHIEDVRVNIDEMLPSETRSWRYHGSLTTPPCSEGARWIVMQTPIQLDTEQIEQFRRKYTGNNRPTQPLNERPIVMDSPVVR